MAGIFPKSPDVATFWHNILNKISGVVDPPAQSWDMRESYDPAMRGTNRIYTQKGGFLGDLAQFNPMAHGITPNAVDGTEPAQWLALAVARQALTDAGYSSNAIPEKERTAVILGRGAYIDRANTSHFQHGSILEETIKIVHQLNPDYSADDLDLLRSELLQTMPKFDATAAQGLIPNIIAGRIANKLDLMGPAYTVDAACASSIVAIEHAVKGLRSGEFDLALVGGIYAVSPAPMTMVFAQLRVLSHQGIIKPFSADGDGTLLGEGIGMVVLKRLDDALTARQRIYAVIKGIGSANDGSGKSLIAPRVEGAVKAQQRAFADAAIDPNTVELVEAHGLGTPIGDATEFQALTAVYGAHRGSRPLIALGTVKPMTGHLMPASGVAGLIKAALALHHKILPPTLNVEHPNPSYDWANAPFYLNGEVKKWTHSAEYPRRAAVNSFGFGGVSAHVLLEEAPAHTPIPISPTLPMPQQGNVQLNLNPRTLTLSDSVAHYLSQKYQKRESISTRPATQEPTSLTQGEKTMTQTPHNGVLSPLAPAMMAAYTDLMKQFLNVQRDVMIAALGGHVTSAEWQPTQFDFAPTFTSANTIIAHNRENGNGHSQNSYPTVVPPMPDPVTIVAPSVVPANNGHHTVVETTMVAAAPAPVAKVVTAAPESAEEEIRNALLAIVSDRTGYPAEMIGLDLDLEADLGIDSIKRVEILGSFQSQFGHLVSAAQMDELTQQKSLNQIISYILQ